MDTCHTMKSPAEEIASAIDAAMKKYDSGRGISQAELSRKSGVPQPTISRTLSGKTVPEVDTLSRIISVLGKENVNIPDSLFALTRQVPMTERDRLDSYLLHRLSALEAVVRLIVQSRDLPPEEIQRLSHLMAETLVANDLHSHTMREEESRIRQSAFDDSWRSIFS